jgi:SAM-dependent methyltransferase
LRETDSVSNEACDSAAAKDAYEAFAPVYDDFTASHNFGLWLENLWPAVEGHRPPGRSLLDVGCGTGKSFLAMLDRGWSVTACDISPQMLAIAREKAKGRASLLEADMRDLPRIGKFDLVWCLDDALNYMVDRDELTRALAGMRSNLAPEGLLMFDVNTIKVFRTFFADEVVVERNGKRLVWSGLSRVDAPPGGFGEARFHVESLSGSPKIDVPDHIHRERHFDESTVLDAMARAGLDCLAVYGHDDDAVPEQPLEEERHTKAVYLGCTSSG